MHAVIAGAPEPALFDPTLKDLAKGAAKLPASTSWTAGHGERVQELVAALCKTAASLPLSVSLSGKRGTTGSIKTLKEQFLACLVVPSYASRCMSLVMYARNSTSSTFSHKVLHVVKAAVTATGLPLITVAATVESVAYKALIVISSKTWISRHRIEQRFESSKFTIFWTVAMLYHNISFKMLPVEELHARRYLAQPT